MWTAILGLLFIFSSTACAASAVLGVDLGTEYIKAALVKPGIPLDIVLTKDSKRKELAALAIKPLKSKVSTADSDVFPERLYGGDAAAVSVRFPHDVYPNLKPLLGVLKKDNDIVSGYKRRYPGLQMVEWQAKGTVGFQSPSFAKEEEPFSVEELLAMELQNIKRNAESIAGKGAKIEDVVITIPAFYTAEEKMAVALAADLAGLRILSLISDGLAVGLNYATSRTFPSISEGGKPEVNLIYDMGAGSTTATVVRFQGRTVKDIGKFNKTIQEVQVLGTGWDRTLGGDALNDMILNDMIEKFAGSTKMKDLGAEPKHIRSHTKTIAKLWKEAEKIRQVLSANTETSSSFEGLYYEDTNFKYKLTRSDFESLVSAHADRVQGPITDALQSAKLSLTDIESVILHGGAVRTPFIQKQLEAAIGNTDKIKTNVNSDEAAVFGAAFRAAGLSPSFRVKDIRAGDSAGYAVSMTWTADGKERRQKLFLPTSAVGAEKQVSFKNTEDFAFNLYEQRSQMSGYLSDAHVLEVQTQNLTASVAKLIDSFGCSSSNISSVLTIRLNPLDGFPEVVKGSVSCEVSGPVKKSGMVEGMKDFLGFGSKKDDQQPLRDDETPSSSATISPIESSTTTSDTKSSTSEAASESSTNDDGKLKDIKTRIETVNIGFSTEPGIKAPLTAEGLRSVKDRLAAFDASDKSRVKREEALNTLEAYTYKVRDLLSDEAFIKVSTEQQRNEIEEQSKSASEWIYGEGAEASQKILKDRLAGLQGLVKPVEQRKSELRLRPNHVQALRDALEQTERLVDVVRQYRKSMEEADAAISSASEAAKTESSSTEIPSPSVDEFADLDDEPSTPTSIQASATPEIPKPMYSAEDLTSIVEKHEATQQWLNEKVAEQEKLSPADPPAFLASDIASKSKELNEIVMKLLQKQMMTPPKPKLSGKSKTSKVKVTAKSTATQESDSTAEASASTSQEPTEETPVVEILEELPGMEKLSREDIEEMIRKDRGAPSKGKGTKSKAKGSKATTKPKSKSKSKTKTKTKTNKKDEGHSEL